MRIITFFLFLPCVMFFSSCSEEAESDTFLVAPGEIVKNIRSLLAYKEQVKFYETFTALDNASNAISKKKFLKLFSTGKYLPLKLTTKGPHPHYKLHDLDQSVAADIRITIKQWGAQEYANYQVVGAELPDFIFKDLEGNVYTNESIKGKIVVIKCWFIGCLPCIQEMPALNEIKEQYANRKDILFLSLCWESKNKVESFLKKKEFRYAVIPDQYSFLREELKIKAYPTHFVLDGDGKILNKTNDYEEMHYILKNAALQ